MATGNYKRVQRILGIILVANLGVAVLKIIFGTIIQSSSMTADGFHSLTDGASNIVGLLGIWFASKPVDLEHPYGHKKFETLAGLFIGGMLFAIGIKVIIDAFERFINPVSPQISTESLIVLIFTLCINIFVCRFEYKKGKSLSSQILISDSMHTRSDIYVSLGVLVTLICIKMGLPSFIDPLASLVVSGFIIHAGYEIFKYTSDILVDKAVIDPDKLKQIALSFESVRDAHRIRSRGNENEFHVDMHIMTDPHMSVEMSHALIHNIEKKIQSELSCNVQVIIHIEPYNDAIGDSPL
ncbi:cation diffusion facilitator family transporter [Anaerobacterium chartisolvens]|uniref:Cation diffusion facilitator family transporter n=1 Tax=Anaerobacterium chartisolvens TaxID=1297424 RepID=A0A369AV67_9FIRM|nr:cation diffusion facilitator family transporter [Anaerobacterium chartisolvens]RCX12975.1 cation diffusion facilitator family transporter [Anaerobacterium chartisolvens]